MPLASVSEAWGSRRGIAAQKNGAARQLDQARGPGEKKVGGALLSRALERSIIAAGALNGRVRDGNGCRLPAGATNQMMGKSRQGARPRTSGEKGPAMSPGKPPARPFPGRGRGGGQVSRPIRSGRLKASRPLHFRPVDPVVFRGPSGPCGRGRLVSGGAWRLDAFSAYPFATWLPGGARRPDNRNTRGRPPPVLSY